MITTLVALSLAVSTPSTSDAEWGYVLVAPLRSTTTYLVGRDGEVVHSWASSHRPGNAVELLPSGNLLRAEREGGNPTFSGGGEGGRLQEIAPDGSVVWDYVYSSVDVLHHHDFEVLPNGNVLLIGWESKSPQEQFEAGRDPELIDGDLWVDHVVEIAPERPTGGRIVWEWHLWDHLVQDRVEGRANYGDPSKTPGRVDINADAARRRPSESEDRREMERMRALGYAGDEPTPPGRGRGERGGGGRRGGRADWNHTNAIAYNAKLDHIALSVREFGEIWILDHGITTEEARGPAGDLLYRWGNPAIWRRGDADGRQLFGQHDVRWIPEGAPGAGNLTVFNNGMRGAREWSSVDEIELPTFEDGAYARAKGGYGPAAASWRWLGDERGFYSERISGAQRLPTGNTLVCIGEEGRVVEVDPEGSIVWEWTNPFFEDEGGPQRGRDDRRDEPRGERGGGPGRPGERPGPGGRDERGGRGGRGRGRGPGSPNALFRAPHYMPDHPGIEALLRRL